MANGFTYRFELSPDFSTSSFRSDLVNASTQSCSRSNPVLNVVKVGWGCPGNSWEMITWDAPSFSNIVAERSPGFFSLQPATRVFDSSSWRQYFISDVAASGSDALACWSIFNVESGQTDLMVAMNDGLSRRVYCDRVNWIIETEDFVHYIL